MSDAALAFFSEAFAPHARERSLRALHDAGYDVPAAQACMREGGAWWCGEALDNEWRSFGAEEVLRFEHAVDATGKRWGAVARLVRVDSGAEQAVAAEESLWRQMQEAVALRGVIPDAAEPIGVLQREEGGGRTAEAKSEVAPASASTTPSTTTTTTSACQAANVHPVTRSLDPSSRREPLDLPRSGSARFGGGRSPVSMVGFFYGAWKRYPEYSLWKERRRELGSAAFFYHRSVCDACSNGGRIVCCDTCFRSFHPECSGMSEQDAGPPEGATWMCPVCRATLVTSRQRRAAAGFVRSELARLAACADAFEAFASRDRLSRVRDRAETLRSGGVMGAELGIVMGPAADQVREWVAGRDSAGRSIVARRVWERLGVRWQQFDEIPRLSELVSYSVSS